MLSYTELRQRLADAVAALEGWRQSPYAFDDFARVPDSLADQVFAVGLPTSEDSGDSRQNPRKLEEGSLVATDVRVRFVRRLRTTGSDAVTDTDTALDAEDVLRQTIMGVDRAGLHLRYHSTPSRVSAGGWHRCELRFTVIHRIPLE